MYWSPRLLHALWEPKAIYITENGVRRLTDESPTTARVYDTDRVMYLRNCLTQLQRATADGVPVKGYFLWSTMDNFEWTDGYRHRFGIVHVDFKTQKRTPKESAREFREAARRNDGVWRRRRPLGFTGFTGAGAYSVFGRWNQ